MAGIIEVQELAAEWLGWRYPEAGERQEAPRLVSGWPSSLVGTGTRAIDCSSFAAWLLFALYPGNYTREDYEALQIYDAAKPWSNVDWVVAQRIGVERAPLVDEWAYVQTWEGVPGQSRGHARLVLTRPHGEILTLESTTTAMASGPQWRTMTWADLQSRRAMRAVTLR